MMDFTASLPANLTQNIQKISQNFGLFVYDIQLAREHGDFVLRILLTGKDFSLDPKNMPISVDICAEISQILSPLLDVELANERDFADGYVLEVGSCGLERSLKIPRHFALSIGDFVVVHKKSGEKLEKISGILQKFGGDFIKISLDPKNSVKISLSDIKKARTEILAKSKKK